jgi:hypothetical protein
LVMQLVDVCLTVQYTAHRLREQLSLVTGHLLLAKLLWLGLWWYTSWCFAALVAIGSCHLFFLLHPWSPGHGAVYYHCFVVCHWCVDALCADKHRQPQRQAGVK